MVWIDSYCHLLKKAKALANLLTVNLPYTKNQEEKKNKHKRSMDLIIPLHLPLQIYSMQDHIPVRQSQKVVFSLIEKFWILLFTVETELSKNLNNSKLYTYLIFTFSSSSELLKKMPSFTQTCLGKKHMML